MNPPGRLFDIGGRRLHAILKGAGPGPTVVFEAGAGLFSQTWLKVQDRVAELAPTIAWDRPGFGWSDAPKEPLSIDSVCDDLQALLEVAPCPAPYVLVGHSLGGFYVRRFAERRPDLVAGLVLVDPSQEGQFEVMTGVQRLVQRVAGAVIGGLPGLARRIGRGQIQKLVRKEFPELDPAAQAGMADAWMRRDSLKIVFKEVTSAASGAATLGGAGSLGDLPVIVLAAGKPAGGEKFRRHRQDVALPALEALSRQGSLRVVEGSGHGIQLEAPEAVVAAVREVLLRTAEPVA